MGTRSGSRRRWIGFALVALVAAIALAWLIRQTASRLPEPGDRAYEQVTTAFYHGLAALEVGLLDDARQQFARATEIVAAEPAAWANLAIAHLRLGDLDAAAEPIERAAALAPTESALALLAGRMESARGNFDAAIAHYRRAVELDPTSLRARFALADEIERTATAEPAAETPALLDELLARAPANLAVILERARAAARRGDAARLADSLDRLTPLAAGWPPVAMEQLAALRSAVAAAAGPADDPSYVEAERRTNQLRNVLARVPAYGESLAAVRTPTELIAEPFVRFLALVPPRATPSPPDRDVAWAPLPPGDPAKLAMAFTLAEGRSPAVVMADGGRVQLTGTPGATWALPGGDVDVVAGRILPVDWNHDFLMDLLLVGPGGVRLVLQDASGDWRDATADAGTSPARCAEAAGGCRAAWAADLDMEGDVDIILAPDGGDPVVLRNNGDGTWQTMDLFPGVTGARGFAWADLDGDADPDAAFIDARGALHVFSNRQGANFAPMAVPDGAIDLAAVAAADANADGRIDLVVLDRQGVVRRLSVADPGTPGVSEIRWDVEVLAAASGAERIFMADIDNNGALDLVASGSAGTQVWLADERHRFDRLAADPPIDTFSVIDVDGDGRLDLVGVEAGRTAQYLGRGSRPYHWKSIHPRAQQNAGDQRINSYGVGGEIEVRSGLLRQKQVLSGGPLHFGLGDRTSVDVVRIVWPNGVAQAEFGVGVDDTIVAEQRLKGSCPWVFAWDGETMGFVTDFIWRSPLGLRINAQETAGTSQTEDWVRIAGHQLVPREGAYDVRITAELWETHFFDHVSLLVVDRPSDIDVFVDERFTAARPPSLELRAIRGLTPVRRARDHTGRDVTSLVERVDGRHVATLTRGRYQGIAHEHHVEIDLGHGPRGPHPVLIARGWVYPTDSSINLAISQGRHDAPRGLALEAERADGRWVVVDPDLGFPAGKNKTMVIDLRPAGDARRVRLRTNLEVYWDALSVGEQVDGSLLRTTRLQPAVADLAFRGYSVTIAPRDESPETPVYERLANTAQRWRDLTGYYTRFGDVRELLAAVDDRYVIMNAGDELRLAFAEQPPPPAGWARDFVLIGDGWEKDGDYNTAYSQTVLPLPSHAQSSYEARSETLELEDDPVYRRYREDWERYHTRYVTPRSFLRGLGPR